MFNQEQPLLRGDMDKIHKLERLALEAYDAGVISLNTVSQMEACLPGVIFNNYPEGGFSVEPSKQNITVALENAFVKTNGVKLAIIATLIAFIFKYVTSINSTKFATGGAGGGGLGSPASVNDNKKKVSEEAKALAEQIKETQEQIARLEAEKRLAILNQNEHGLGELLTSMVDVFNQFEPNKLMFDVKKTSEYSKVIRELSNRYNREIFFNHLDHADPSSLTFFYLPPFLNDANPDERLGQVEQLFGIFSQYGADVMNWLNDVTAALSNHNTDAKTVGDINKQLYPVDGSTPFPVRLSAVLYEKLKLTQSPNQDNIRYRQLGSEVKAFINKIMVLPNPEHNEETVLYRKRLKELQESFFDDDTHGQATRVLDKSLDLNEKIVKSFESLDVKAWQEKLTRASQLASRRKTELNEIVKNPDYDGYKNNHVELADRETLFDYIHSLDEVLAFISMWLDVVAALPKFSITIAKVDQNLGRIIDKLHQMVSHQKRLASIISQLAKGN